MHPARPGGADRRGHRPTFIVDPTLESVGVLGIIVVVRILLSFSLEVEIDGVWPWRRRELDARTGRESADSS